MRASRPNFAPGYGVVAADQGRGLVEWGVLSGRMAPARNYWIATVDASGNPHTTPIWGVWLDDRLHFGVDPASVKARNLAGNPNAVIHTESGDDVAIIECTVTSVRDPLVAARVLAAYRLKYGLAEDFSFDPVLVATPTTGFAWEEADFPGTATRFTGDVTGPSRPG